MFHKDSRFITVEQKNADGQSLVAFAIFRFDSEETMEDEEEDVVYWSAAFQCCRIFSWSAAMNCKFLVPCDGEGSELSF